MLEWFDRTILVTGGTGSFGNAVVERLLKTEIKEIRILSRDEAKQYDMRNRIQDPRLRFFLGDVRDRVSVDRAMRGVDMVFHAAALKQVPNCELFPDQAILTNSLGSMNVVRSAVEHGVRRVVGLSTDKAVHPINAMGMSKALMEKILQAEAYHLPDGSDTVICCVRYGNVMATRGSVIPLFISQLQADRPLTVTDPRMTRFLLKLEEAVDLVEMALLNGAQGDIFIRKAPACTIETLAQAVRDLVAPHQAIHVVGSRHGEKLHETLALADEMARAVDMGSAWRLPLRKDDLIDPVGSHAESPPLEDYTSGTTDQLSLDAVKTLISSLPAVAPHIVSAGGMR